MTQLPPGITLPPWITLPPGIDIGDLPDSYMLIHQALITQRSNTNLNQHLCGGALVLNFTIITSANCLLKGDGNFYDASELSVALGFYSVQDDAAAIPKFFDVKEVIVHGRFNRRTKANNIAMIKLSSEVSAGDKISPTAPSGDKISSSMECFLLAYSNNAAKITEIKPKYNSACSKQTQESWPLEIFCSGESDFDTCEGSEGSALICGGLFQGIVTRTCQDDKIMQYTDASQFFYWIGIHQLDENPYRFMDNELVRYFLFSALDYVAWLVGTPKIADRKSVV